MFLVWVPGVKPSSGALSENDWTQFIFPQLDCDEDSPNFDEDGRDEYNEIHMLV